MGNAIMSFYSALIDLLGRCAPEMHVRFIETAEFVVSFLRQTVTLCARLFSLLQLISKGKGEALRIRAILRSLVPTEDLVGIISIPLKMPITNKGNGYTTQCDTSTRGHIGVLRHIVSVTSRRAPPTDRQERGEAHLGAQWAESEDKRAPASPCLDSHSHAAACCSKEYT